MSCHNIGRGIKTIINKIVALYEEGRYSADTARELIAAARRGVHWCDGNEDEAIDEIRRCYCGRCLKKMNKGAYLFSVWEVSGDVTQPYDIIDCKRIEDELPLASDRLCEECFKIVLSKHCNNPEAGDREVKYIMENEREERYTVVE